MNKVIKILTIATVFSLCSVSQVVLAGSVIIIPIPVRVTPDVTTEEPLSPDVPVVETAKVEASDDDYKWKTTEKPNPTGSVKEW